MILITTTNDKASDSEGHMLTIIITVCWPIQEQTQKSEEQTKEMKEQTAQLAAEVATLREALQKLITKMDM